LKKFAEVIDRLLSRNKDVKVVLTGSAGEKAHVARLFEFLDEAKKDRIIDLSGALSLEQFLALLLQLPLFLTNDSGPFHLAQVQRTPTVSIWGAGSPDLYGPYGPEKARHRVVYKRWPCSPCLYVYRTDAGFFCNGEVTCLNGITSIEVAEATENHINDLKRKA
jgi:ADP-heptose:LPS heptosyltransferase